MIGYYLINIVFLLVILYMIGLGIIILFESKIKEFFAKIGSKLYIIFFKIFG